MRLRELLVDVPLASPLPAATDPDAGVTDVLLDSRLVTPGSLFVSVTREPGVSAAHVADARANGAGVTVGPPGAGADVTVADGAVAAARIGCAFHRHPSHDLDVVAITGTNGKSSVTHTVSGLLTTLGQRTGAIGTIDITLDGTALLVDRRTPTTPESIDLQALLRRFVDAGARQVVMEASSIALAEHRLDGTDVAVGCFTNLSHDHLDSHGSLEAYEAAKLRLFDFTKSAVVNRDDVVGRRIAGHHDDVVTYGIEGEADIRAEQLRHVGDRMEFLVRAGSTLVPASVVGTGTIPVANGLAALAVTTRLGQDIGDAVMALAQQSGPPGRMQLVAVDRPYTVMIDYAHSPDALQQVLETLRMSRSGRLITVFGCGGDRDRAKRPIMGRIAAGLSDVVIITDDNPRTEDPERIIAEILAGTPSHPDRVRVEHDRVRAIGDALSEARAGDTVLVAGKGSESWQIVGRERIPHSDHDVVVTLAGSQ